MINRFMTSWKYEHSVYFCVIVWTFIFQRSTLLKVLSWTSGLSLSHCYCCCCWKTAEKQKVHHLKVLFSAECVMVNRVNHMNNKNKYLHKKRTFIFLQGLYLQKCYQSWFTHTSYLAMFVMPMFVFFVSFLLHFLHLFVDIMSTHSHSCQTCSHGIYTSMMVTFVVTFMMTPFWWVGVWPWVNTSRRNYWISTWCQWIRLGSWSSIRHRSRRCTGSHRRVLAWLGKHTWFWGWWVRRVISRGVERVLWAYWRRGTCNINVCTL